MITIISTCAILFIGIAFFKSSRSDVGKAIAVIICIALILFMLL